MINGKENQRLIVENLTAAVLLFDGRLRLSAANPAAEGLLTTSEKKIRDLEPEAIFPAESHLVSLLRWAMEAGRPFTEQSVQLDRAGSEPITVDCTVTPFSEPKDSDGLLVELVQVDRRSRINREEQLLNQHETIHTMVRGFAHEIRNPLGGLRGA
ncbi:MAG: PAS domain-containing protein, partial [Gammaproteobacteria bacterium]|nr:PAS domain-containing protein [Gammaproteobacteria bacterium]